MSVTTVTTPQTAQAGEQTGGNTGSAPATQSQSGDRTFTQTELDSIIQQRLAKQRETMEGQSAAAREKAEREAEEKRAKEQGEYKTLAEREKARADAAEQKAAETERITRDRLIRTEIKSVAATLGFAAKPEVLHRLVDFSSVEFNEQGDPINVEDLLKALAKDEPYLVGSQAGENDRFGIPRTPGASGGLTPDELKRMEIDRMVKSGKYQGI